VSVALLDTDGEEMEVVASHLSGKHKLPIIVRSADGQGFTIAGLDDLSASKAEVDLLEAIFFIVETAGQPQEIADLTIVYRDEQSDRDEQSTTSIDTPCVDCSNHAGF
jgi:hypothetical protein